MDYLTDMKAILHSKRANLYLIEKCRVIVKDGRVVFLTETKKDYQYWNIPIANTTFILLGMGTSITQAAVRMLSSAGVMIGFTGTGGTPLFSATEIEFFTPQSEYRPTEYMQGWMSFWFDDFKRLKAAKKLQTYRIEFLKRVWQKESLLHENNFYIDDVFVETAIKNFEKKLKQSTQVHLLLQAEALFTKSLYKYAARNTGQENFVRNRDDLDSINIFLNHGNYLAYGLAAVSLWTLGIPHGFAVMHGKTRRGALVFDIADLIKDSIVLPLAFIDGAQHVSEQIFREDCLKYFTKHKVLDYMFTIIKEISMTTDWDLLV